LSQLRHSEAEHARHTPSPSHPSLSPSESMTDIKEYSSLFTSLRIGSSQGSDERCLLPALPSPVAQEAAAVLLDGAALIFVALVRSQRFRRATARTSYLHTRRVNRAHTRSMLSTMATSRGPWCDAETEGEFWRLSPSEGLGRCRNRLVRYPNGTDHRDRVNTSSVRGDKEREREGSSAGGRGSTEGDDRDGDTEREREQDQRRRDLKRSLALATVADAAEEDGSLQDEGDLAEVDTTTQGGGVQTKANNILVSVACELVADFQSVPGTFEVTSESVAFRLKSNPDADDFVVRVDPACQTKATASPLDALVHRDFVVPVSRVRSVLQRRYVLRWSAFEIFMVDRTSLFINVDSKALKKVLRAVAQVCKYVPGCTVMRTRRLKTASVTSLWRQGLVSNFDYIMSLNTAAGRTYNDLSQYPVFPWVLSDYTSDTIDLNDPSVYRDLSWPVGAQQERARKKAWQRYHDMNDPDMLELSGMKPWCFGSHYSNQVHVVYYLVRCEPFTSVLIKLQSGKFDKPDRMFHSIADTYHSINVDNSDNK
ncbi:hypothetical protein KIPB_011189, partial [Kipferlia bialata]